MLYHALIHITRLSNFQSEQNKFTLVAYAYRCPCDCTELRTLQVWIAQQKDPPIEVMSQ
jgi:hypothetical protein